MENQMETRKYKRAKERMEEEKAFYIMLTGYFLLMPFLIFINLKTDPQTQWFWFPLIGCGLSVLGYGLYLFAGKSWEERKIRQIMNNKK
ncbi:2TM domain-containing protein [Epilithonimonas xixisoli]|uniref:2TM domain-containing protein n=1 Tax=Epilithonimonas xixisoli TaxID=1476462 RepID=A0A4R8IGC8_9FLAO|nr:2TM domain-containing protein [Epilithonimonas xixisoli]TDX84534.1 2TM domain-containing protein [Epilithonimonas xixisoli]